MKGLSVQQVLTKIVDKVNNQSTFIQVSLYVAAALLILLMGYGLGRLIGLIFI